MCPATPFQPTRHARGATMGTLPGGFGRSNSNPRATHVARPSVPTTTPGRTRHSNPRATHVARRDIPTVNRFTVRIPTHAPRTWRDPRQGRTPAARPYSNPRATHVARPSNPRWSMHGAFIPTHAPRTWRDLGKDLLDLPLRLIPTHAPRTWRDPTTHVIRVVPYKNSNPRATHVARHDLCAHQMPVRKIPTHAPRTWRDYMPSRMSCLPIYSNPRATYVARRPGDKPRSLQ